MLESTFQHIPGVGEKTEKKLWNKGCHSWDCYLKDSDKYVGSKNRRRKLKAAVLESKGRLENMDHVYFQEKLPSPLVWRAFNPFREHACCLDIETTGLSPRRSRVTTVCLHSGRETKNYVAGDNLYELKPDLDDYKYIITFNGARFDLPFLNRRLGIEFPHLHLDLMYPLKKLGYTGGLKNIEKQLGVNRSTEGVSGADAVRLWKAYKNDSTVRVNGEPVSGEKALELLVKYNREDTVNLMEIACSTVENLEKKTRCL